MAAFLMVLGDLRQEPELLHGCIHNLRVWIMVLVPLLPIRYEFIFKCFCQFWASVETWWRNTQVGLLGNLYDKLSTTVNACAI